MAFLNALNSPLDRLAWVRMFVVFGGVNTLKAARELVNDIFDAGMTPLECFAEDYSPCQLRVFLTSMNMGRCVFFDTETTGLNTKKADIVQIAAIEFIDGMPTGKEFEVFLHTNQDLSKTSDIHGIDAARLQKDGVEPILGLQQFLEFCGDSVLAGHNVKFDMDMIDSNLSRVGLTWVRQSETFDTLPLTRVLHPRLLSYKLEYLLQTLNVEGKNSHNALDDVRATGALAQRLLNDAKEHEASRAQAHKAYQKYIGKFVTGLEPLWRKVFSDMQEVVTLSQTIEAFLQYAEQSVKYSLDSEERAYVDTLIHFLNRDTTTRTLRTALARLVPELSTYSEADLITGDEKVVVSTVHKAKGLEFEAVVVTTCVKDVYPFFSSKTDEKIEEDARLLYVGLTRAKVAIAITTHDESVNQYGRHFSRWPSPFLNFMKSDSFQGKDAK
jgi:DNA helicase-2/ATP-dependent DNA helicase PcrA